MTIKVMHPQSFFEEVNIKESSMSLIDRYFLMRSHPRKIVFDIIGVIWGAYFLWNQNWQVALGFSVFMSAMGLFFTRGVDPELMSETTLGKIGLLHKHPINLALNIIGFVPLVAGLWRHELVTILVGLSIIVMGHFFGWSEVNSKLRMI